MKESHPVYERLVPFIETLIILIFILIGASGIFSQFQGVSNILSILSIGLSIAFALVLIPIAFHYTRLAWREVEKTTSE